MTWRANAKCTEAIPLGLSSATHSPLRVLDEYGRFTILETATIAVKGLTITQMGMTVPMIQTHFVLKYPVVKVTKTM
jgi:hypothetical protein